MDRFDALANRIWDAALQNVSEEDVVALAKQYPYFAPAQMMLLNKTAPDTNAYADRYQKAVLYYPVPAAFSAFLHPPTELPEVAVAEEAPNIIENTAAQQQSTPAPEAVIASTFNNEPQFTNAPLLFEPYHTVDYFASQGIKNAIDEAPKDKFGKQLKSFTDWLKMMKKLPVTELEKTDASAEKGVESLAAHSISGADVITESMAEVWLKQGNREKAIEIYRKLSLQNPSKSPYFAAKIEGLSTQNL